MFLLRGGGSDKVKELFVKKQNENRGKYYGRNESLFRRNIALAYYVENYDMPVNEYKNKKIDEMDENFIFGGYGVGEKIAHITKLIGSSYSVTYEDQENKQYGLIASATVDNDGKYYFNDIIIKVDICMKDGSHQYKRLLIKPVKSERGILPEIQIRIL